MVHLPPERSEYASGTTTVSERSPSTTLATLAGRATLAMAAVFGSDPVPAQSGEPPAAAVREAEREFPERESVPRYYDDFLEVLEREELWEQLDSDHYKTRQRGQARLTDLLTELRQTLHPLPSSFLQDLAPQEPTLEQKLLFKYAVCKSAPKDSWWRPTIIPIANDSNAEQALHNLTQHCNVRFLYDQNTAERLRTVRLESDVYTFHRLLTHVCQSTSTAPRVSPDQHLALELVPCETPPRFALDQTGQFLATAVDTGKDKPLTISVLADPQRGLSVLKEVQSNLGRPAEVSVQPFLPPQADLSEICKPTLKQEAEPDPDLRPNEIVVHTITLSHPVEATIPLESDHTLVVHKQQIFAELDAETNQIGIHILQPDADMPSVFRIEMRALLARFVALDSSSNELPTRIQQWKGLHTDPVQFRIRLQTEGEVHAVRARVYALESREGSLNDQLHFQF